VESEGHVASQGSVGEKEASASHDESPQKEGKRVGMIPGNKGQKRDLSGKK